jgi:hypothetical protein
MERHFLSSKIRWGTELARQHLNCRWMSKTGGSWEEYLAYKQLVLSQDAAERME